ncbi:MAG: AAA family ATPase [Clostridia bacterium]|nr:AAA family ATPase [Clostridia bacterium]
MTDPIKISALQLENVKRVRAVALTPTENGLTILGGRNGQGKTSVLDAIAWALGGDRYKPTGAAREGSVLPPDIRITLSNGLLVERKGKNSSLTVTDPEGKRYGQKLLDAFVGTFAIDLPRFLHASDKEKAETLLRVIGVGDQLKELEHKCEDVYSHRHAVGQIVTQKEAHAKELPFHEGLPEEPVSASDLIRRQQDILLRNAENARKRARKAELEQRRIDLDKQIARLMNEANQVVADLKVAEMDALDLYDESTAELEQNIRDVDMLNAKIRQNLDRRRADAEAKAAADQYNDLTNQLEKLRADKRALLDGAALPLPGLTVENGCLTYKGHRWDCMSGAEQLIVGTAIARALNPSCGFVLLDKLEQLDAHTLNIFNGWLMQHGLQAIATRVSTGSECTVIIEDGGLRPDFPPITEGSQQGARAPEPSTPFRTWKAGEF